MPGPITAPWLRLQLHLKVRNTLRKRARRLVLLRTQRIETLDLQAKAEAHSARIWGRCLGCGVFGRCGSVANPVEN